MNGILQMICSLSLSGSAVLLPVLALRPVLRGRLSQSFQYYVWLIVIARLLLPIPSPVRAANPVFQGMGHTVERHVWGNGEPGIPSIPEKEKDGAAPAMPKPQSRPEESRGWSNPAPVLFTAWAGTALVLFARKTAGYHSFLRFVRAGSREAESPVLLCACAEVCKKAGLRGAPALYVNPMIASPMLAGVFPPFIVVPHEELPEEDARNILMHELTHYKRLDFFYKWVVQLAVCIHWFNPLVYLAQREIDRACELSCDEAVIRCMDAEDKRAYGDTLIASLQGKGSFTSPTVSIPLNENAKLIKERLGCIMNYKRPSKIHKTAAFFMSVLIAGGALLCGCTVPAAAESPAPAVADTSTWITSGNAQSFSTGSPAIRKPGNNYLFISCFYQNSYILEIGWNVDQSKYPVKKQVTVGGQSFLIAFDGQAKAYAEDQAVLNAAGQTVVERTRQEIANGTEFPITDPLVLEVSGPYQESANQLAERFYKENRTGWFAAVVAKADPAVKASIAQKAYNDDKISFFNSVSDSLGKEEAARFAERAYQDDKIAFFNSLSDDLSNEVVAKLTERAYQDDKIAFFNSLSDGLSNETIAKLAERAYQDDKIAFFNSLSDGLSNETIARLAERAYQDDKIAFFNSLSDGLSNETIAKLAERAYQDDKIAFFNSMSDGLSNETIAKLAERAYQDDKIAFFNSLSDSLSNEQVVKLSERARRDGKFPFFNSLSDYLSNDDTANLAERAYLDNKYTWFTSLVDLLSSEQAGKLAERAYLDDKYNYFTSLVDLLNGEQAGKLAERAYLDDKQTYFNRLADLLR